MKSFRGLNKYGKFGFIFFLVISVSFAFLLVSPYIPNPLGAFLDELVLAQASARIQQYRTDIVRLRLEFANGTPIQGWNVSYNLTQHEFLFGCNIYSFDSFGPPSYNQLYRTYFKNLFNMAVLPFYWKPYENPQGVFPTESSINNTIQWCFQNNITMKGHPLAWSRPSGVPDWLPLENPALVRQLLEDRITQIISKYGDNITYWDVVNEPTHTETFGGMNPLENVLQPLLWTRAANSSMHLTVNDYGILGHDFGLGPFYQLINALILQGAPLDSIGFQAHEPRTDWIPATELWATLDAYSSLGKPIHITEFAPPSSPVPITNSWQKGLWSEAMQAEYARRFYTLCFSHPGIGALIWWDLSEAEASSWIEGGALLRSDMTPKPAYTTLDRLINQEWHTIGTGISDASGWVQFRGFYGDYNISVQNGLYTYNVSVESGSSNSFVLTV